MNGEMNDLNVAWGGRATCVFDTCTPEEVKIASLSPLMDDMCFCTFFADFEHPQFFFSKGMADAIGQTGSGAIFLPDFLQHVCEQDRAETARRYGEFFTAAASGKADKISFQHSLSTSDKGPLLLQVHMQVLQDGDKKSIWGAILDKTKTISERIVSQLFADGIGECIYYYDTVMDVCYLNTHFMNTLKMKTQYIENASCRIKEYVHPDDYSRIMDYFMSYLNGESRKPVGEFRLLTSEGKQIWMRTNGISNFDVSGSLRYVTGLFVDISDKKKTELLQQNIIANSASVIFIADLEKDHMSFSDNLLKIFPDASVEFTGNIIERIARRIVPEDQAHFMEQIDQIMSGKADSFNIEIRVRRSDGRKIWISGRGKSFKDAANQSQMLVGTLVNLSEMSQFKEILEKSVSRNEITDLPVRKRLVFDLEKVINDSNVLSAAIILIDIKEFHTYNDRFGRAAGDEILRGISDMIAERLPSGGSLFHINIDHFCVLWPHASRVQVENFMAFLQEETARPLVVRNENIYVAFAMSAALFPSCGCSADDLLINAEITLNKVKRDKRRHYSIFIPSDKKEFTEKLNFESQLSKSILNTKDNFLLYYQPLVDAQEEALIGAEALLRWISPSKDIISPEHVITALEATGHMDGVGAWVLEQAIFQCSKWICEGVNPDFVMHVNITAEDLMRPNYSSSVISLLSKYCLNPGNLILEITETSLMKSVSSCRQNLIRLRKAGIKISLDDFGTGYSSLNYLRELPVDEIKIDRAFLENIHKDRYNHSFISAMIILAHSIPRNVCIEGIETFEQADTVRALNADVFQGFYFGKPITSVEFEARFFAKSMKRS